MAGISRGSISAYLREFMWRKIKTKSRIDAFNVLLTLIRNQYSIEEIDFNDLNDFTFDVEPNDVEPDLDSDEEIETIEDVVVETPRPKNKVYLSFTI
jgi:hypothetical protein